MTNNTPIIQAYSRLVHKTASEFYAAARNNRKRALDHEKQARIWFEASEEVWTSAQDSGASYEEVRAMHDAFHASGVLDAQRKLNHMRLYGEQEDEHERTYKNDPTS